jgi:signal transduction histidine kinase
VFERFYRADQSGAVPGTGLGMSLVKEILDLHAGHIDIDSQPGLGTTVTLWWPADAAPACADAAPALPECPTRPHR